MCLLHLSSLPSLIQACDLDSLCDDCYQTAFLAQLAERPPSKRKVSSSNLLGGILYFLFLFSLLPFHLLCWLLLKNKKDTLPPGIEPGPRAWQARILTTILQETCWFATFEGLCPKEAQRLSFAQLNVVGGQAIAQGFVPQRSGLPLSKTPFAAMWRHGELAQVAERSLSMREAPGSMPGFSIFVFHFAYFLFFSLSLFSHFFSLVWFVAHSEYFTYFLHTLLVV